MPVSIKLLSAGLGPVILHTGIPIAVAAGCFAATYFSPVFKKYFLWAGTIALAVASTQAVGYRDAMHRQEAQAKIVAETVEAAVSVAHRNWLKDQETLAAVRTEPPALEPCEPRKIFVWPRIFKRKANANAAPVPPARPRTWRLRSEPPADRWDRNDK